MAKKDISAVNGPKTRTTINHTQLPDELMATYDLKREGIRQMRSMQTTKDVGGTDGDLLIRVKTSPMYKTHTKHSGFNMHTATCTRRLLAPHSHGPMKASLPKMDVHMSPSENA